MSVRNLVRAHSRSSVLESSQKKRQRYRQSKKSLLGATPMLPKQKQYKKSRNSPRKLLLLLLNSRSLRLKLLQSQRQLLYPSRLRNLLRRLQLRLQSLRRLHLLLLRNLLPGRVSSLV